MSEISKAYDPQSVEDKWYDFWLKEGCFTADPARVTPKRPAYSIVIPPPNVTGVLTMGHVLNNTIQDILARKARMDGKEVLWLPGTDHAGIATQTAVERALKKAGEIRHRDDLGREKFLEKIWNWKEKHGGIIIQQLKKLGCSCDWTRERFTMDAEYSRCVAKVFVDLYKKGLIYRGKRMVNWCPASLTALSDEEVIMKEQKGWLYYFKVEVTEKDGPGIYDDEGKPIYLTIATTRPETIPGDTAVAVNPKDPRYTHLVGKHVLRPLPIELPRDQKLIPIIADEHVDFEFGTGVLKVTPAHDKVDFEIWARARLHGTKHGIAELRDMLPIDIMDPDGTMNGLAGADLKGLDRFKARKVAVEKLKEIPNAWDKEEPHTNNLGFSERADVPIEPRLSEQWFMKYPSLESSRACVANGSLKFYPSRWAKVYDHWMGNINDWCISRQLWWGHRVPVWRPAKSINEGWNELNLPFDPEQLRPWTDLQDSNGFECSLSKIPGQTTIFRIFGLPDKDFSMRTSDVFAATFSLEEARELEARGFVQEPDVLDTWCSSWLWPFATMGWTGEKEVDEKNATLKSFYPTTDLVTAPDIIFFWVARMIMAGFEYMTPFWEQEADRLELKVEERKKFLDERALPFRNVYFTGIIRDKQGRKMSKSLGNSPDPLDLIAKFGADALRFGVMRAAPLGQDILFDEQNVELGRNFCNKLWNACRFRQMQAGVTEGEIRPELLSSDDKWILLRLDQAIREIDAAFAEYRFNEVTQTLYRFFWSEYCDWFIEASKAVLTSGIRPTENQMNAPETLPLKNESGPGAEPSAPTGIDDLRRANKIAVLDFVLGIALRLFHPLLPFITEELWHGLGYCRDLPHDQGGRTIMLALWPKPFDEDFKEHYGLDESDERFANAKYALVGQGRNLRREGNIPSNKKVKFVFKPAQNFDPSETEVLRLLLNADPLEIAVDYLAPKGTPTVRSELGELYLPLDGFIDIRAEQARLSKELVKIEAEIEKVRQRLDNADFVKKVPSSVLDENKKRLSNWESKRSQVQAALKRLTGEG